MRIMYKEQPKIWGGGLTPLKIIFQKFGGGGAGAPPPKLAGGKPHELKVYCIHELIQCNFVIIANTVIIDAKINYFLIIDHWIIENRL